MSVLGKDMSHWLNSDSRHHIRIPEHTGEIPSIWTVDESSGHERNLHSIVIITEKPRKTERERERYEGTFSKLCRIWPPPERGERLVVAHQRIPCHITNCEASHSVLDFPQYKIECSVNRPTTRNLFLTYDVPYRSIMYLLYPCVNKIQFKTSVHISMLFWPHWMPGCTHSSTTGLVNEGLRFCIS